MAIVKNEKKKGAAAGKDVSMTLMGNQDTKKKGDGLSMEKIRYSFMIPAALLQEAKDYAAERGMSVTRLLIEGLRWRLKQED